MDLKPALVKNVRRTPFYASLILTALLGLQVGQAGNLVDSKPLETVRAWVWWSIADELASQRTDFNKLASLIFPLSHDARTSNEFAAQALLNRVRLWIATISPDSLNCEQWPDYYLLHAFIAEQDTDALPFDIERFACLQSGELFDLANALIFLCGYTSVSPDQVLPGGLKRLQDVQTQQGYFARNEKRPAYYLTTHAMLGLHLCATNSSAVTLAQKALQYWLPWLVMHGWFDAVAETLIFLRWTGDPLANEQAVLNWLKYHQNTDGGLCFRRVSLACESHWHASSLLYDLLLTEREARKQGKTR